MAVRGIRGAITIASDNDVEVLEATDELLTEIIKKNQINSADIASIIFTTTQDIKSAFPAKAARTMGLQLVPLLCSQEIGVPGSIPLCIRVLLHLNTELKQDEVNHVYLREATRLREDLLTI